ncbi:hypothetical protein FJ951_27005 [Mesorhizobium sp. B2-2-3]|uniref:hypothetical protein n=1 Tax=Mesorhizobium sp. B2-2-3 TaxID=2589963 RepID=UPI0011289736|nr:hypothetical protein [Mesorhizobium sp. B2-2-3]TPM39360.1 hypothetical protein FJ951_27005 [Mesorhizobium sp. B2-2-3]
MIEIEGNSVVLSKQVLLREDEHRVKFQVEEGFSVEITFSSDATAKPSLSPRAEEGVFRLPLANFGSPLGMAVSGMMNLRAGSVKGQAGTWAYKYALCVHLIGDKFRLVTFTITEARVV